MLNIFDKEKRQSELGLNKADARAAEAAQREQDVVEQHRASPPRKADYEKPTDALVHDPEARKQRSMDNLKIVLDWLRQEPYSSIEVMALVLRMSVPGARKVLNKLHRDGWLVRDEVPWEGVAGKKHLFGVSSTGLYHLLDNGDVEPPPNRDFKRGRTKSSTGNHVLNIQLARLYHQRVANPDHEFRRYTAARDLPHFGEKHYRWETYPDAVIENSDRVYEGNESRGLTIALEIEQHGKGSKRYKTLIQQHINNMASRDYNDEVYSDRYDLVCYYLPTPEIAKTRRILFDRLIDDLFDAEEAERHKGHFRFGTYDGLPKWILALG